MTTTCVLPHRYQPDRPRYPLPGSSICRGCHDDLSRCLIGEDRFSGGIRERLYGLPELYDQLAELAEVMPAGWSSAVRVSGTPEPMLPYKADRDGNPFVADLRALIAFTLASWRRLVAEKRTEGGPLTDTPAANAGWLSAPGRFDWCTAQDWIGDMADELRQLRSRSCSLVFGPRERSYAVQWCVNPRRGEAGCECSCHADGSVRLPCNVAGGCRVTHDWPCEGVCYVRVATEQLLEVGDAVCGTCHATWAPWQWPELVRLARKLNKGAVA